MDDIYYQIANEEPLFKTGRFHKYKAGWVIWNEDFTKFDGSFESLQQAVRLHHSCIYTDKQPPATTTIEQWIEEKIDKKIKNCHIASKGYVQAAITERLERDASRRNIPKVIEESNSPVSGSKWIEPEEAFVRSELNDFIQNAAKKLGRSPASIKAKIFRMMQGSYQKV